MQDVKLSYEALPDHIKRFVDSYSNRDIPRQDIMSYAPYPTDPQQAKKMYDNDVLYLDTQELKLYHTETDVIQRLEFVNILRRAVRKMLYEFQNKAQMAQEPKARNKNDGKRIASIDEIDRIDEKREKMIYRMYFKGEHKGLDILPTSVRFFHRGIKPTPRWNLFVSALYGEELDTGEIYKVNQALRTLLGNASLNFFEAGKFNFPIKTSRKASWEAQGTRERGKQVDSQGKVLKRAIQ